jgi:hypothetical protein
MKFVQKEQIESKKLCGEYTFFFSGVGKVILPYNIKRF